MKTFTAIFEGGVFRPIGPVDLPERCRVRVEPDQPQAESSPPGFDLASFSGVIKHLPVDPLEYQRTVRDEWDRRDRAE